MKKLHVSLYALAVGSILTLGMTGSVWAQEEPWGGGTQSAGSTGVVWANEAEGLLDWSSSVGDPATGGVQLPGSNFRNVKEAYDDTQWGGQEREASNSFYQSASAIRRFQNGYEELSKKAEESDKQWAQKQEEFKKRAADLQKRANDLLNSPEYKQLVAMQNDPEAQKMFKKCEDGTAEWNEQLGCALTVAVAGKVKETADKLKADTEKYQADLAKAQADREAEVAAYGEQAKELSKELDGVDMDQFKTEFQNDLGFGEKNGFTEEKFNEIISNPAQMTALQQKLDHANQVYGTPKFDLSTEAGRRQFREYLPSSESSTQ